MLKRILAALFLYSVCTGVFAQTLHSWSQDINPDSNLGFWNNTMTVVIFGDPAETFTSDYSLVSEDRVPFLEFGFPKEIKGGLPGYFKGTHKWLVLFCDGFLYAYDSGHSSPINGGFIGRNGHGMLEWEYSASSSLKEKDTVYPASHLADLALSRPWVEGVPGYGIGESIRIKPTRDDAAMRHVLISIGYVSYDKPGLYTENSRPKKIELVSEEGGFRFEVELPDTPNIQLISLPKPVGDLTIIIKDVYKGTKWEDTCINFIVPLSW